MIKLILGVNNFELNNNGKKILLSEREGFKTLKDLKIGSNVLIESDNLRVRKHSGSYYLLFIEEFGEVNILYVDRQGLLRIVFIGREEDTLKGLYNNVADEMVIKVLKSNHKKAYRLVEENSCGYEVIGIEYKNKSSEIKTQIYLSIHDAIKFASYKHRQTGNIYRVITPKGTVLFSIGD